MAEEFGKGYTSAAPSPASRVYFKHGDSSDGERFVRTVVERRTSFMRSISSARLAFWLFSALSVIVLAMAFEITKASGESWIQGFGTMRYDTLCAESTSDTTTSMLSTAETGGVMSESWCSAYSTFIDLQNAAGILCAVAAAFALAAFFSPRTLLIGSVAGVVMFLYAAAQLSAIVLIEKIKDSMPNSVRGVSEWEVEDGKLIHGPTFGLAIAASILAAVDAIALLSLVRSAGVGPIYALLNRYGLGCCDMPLDETASDPSPPPPYEP